MVCSERTRKSSPVSLGVGIGVLAPVTMSRRVVVFGDQGRQEMLQFNLPLGGSYSINRWVCQKNGARCIGRGGILVATDLSSKKGLKLKVGGAERDRTADLRLAKPALSHLSYCPT